MTGNQITISGNSEIAMQKGERLGWVDYARGLAILLVVYRHTMVGLMRSGLDVSKFLFSIQEFLLNVRMPVFFVLSGVFLARSLTRRTQKVVAGKKVRSLLYPYLLWSIILISIQIYLSKFTNSNRTVHDYLYILTQPRELDHMWYLLALFNTTMLMLLLYKLAVRQPVLHILFAFSIHFLHIYFSAYSLFSDLMYNYIFLAIGLHAYEYIGKLEGIKTPRLLLFLLLLLPFFVFGQFFWLHNIDSGYQPIKNWYLVPFLLVIFVACIVYYLVSRILFETGYAKWLSWIGKYSLYIYILHLLVISSVRIFFLQVLKIYNAEVIILLSLILGILVPVYLFRLSRKFNFYFLFTIEKPILTKKL